MVESDFANNSAAHHRGKHHVNNLTDAGPDDANVHGQEPTHDDDGHDQHHEETAEKERNKKMNTRSKSTLTNLIVAVTFVFALAGSAAGFDFNDFGNRFQNDFNDRTAKQNFDGRFSNRFGQKFEAADFNNRFDKDFDGRFQNTFNNRFEANDFDNRFRNDFDNRFDTSDFNKEFPNSFENNRFDRSLA